jgi:hypothetical protein
MVLTSPRLWGSGGAIEHRAARQSALGHTRWHRTNYLCRCSN